MVLVSLRNRNLLLAFKIIFIQIFKKKLFKFEQKGYNILRNNSMPTLPETNTEIKKKKIININIQIWFYKKIKNDFTIIKETNRWL